MSVSVTINKAERHSIATTLKERFNAMIINQEPEPQFLKELTLELYEDSLEDVNKDNVHLCHHQRVKSLNEVSIFKRISIRDKNGERVVIKAIDTDAPYSTSAYNLADNVDVQALLERKEMLHANKIPFVFKDRPTDNPYTDIQVADKIVEKIEKHNDIFNRVIKPIEEQRKLILGIVSKCSSTKQFNTQLPGMENLLPKSVQDKIRVKENRKKEEVPMTEEQKLVNRALTTVAAVSLLEET